MVPRGVVRRCNQTTVMVFSNEKYTTWYYKVIHKAESENRIWKAGKYHRHHILPSSLGGVDDKDNVVLLTPREHYICHLLLMKMTHGEHRVKMVCAFYRFSPGKGATTSKGYQRFCESTKTSMKGANNPFYGRRHSEDTRVKISRNHGMRGRSCYDVWVEKYGVPEADRRKSLMLERRSESFKGESNPAFGKPRSMELRKRQSERMSGKRHPRYGKKRAWVYREGVTRQVEAERLTEFLAVGWTQGRKLGVS